MLLEELLLTEAIMCFPLLNWTTRRALLVGLLLLRGVFFFFDDLSLGDEFGDPLADEGGLL